MNGLENRIETRKLVLTRQDEKGTRYLVERTEIAYAPVPVGSVSLSFDVVGKTCDFSSFNFDIQIPDEDKDKGATLPNYYFEIIFGIFTSSAFRTFDIECVAISACLPDDVDKTLIEFGFEKKKDALIITRSKWGHDSGELISLALFDVLGFANYVSNRGNDIALQLYRKLVNLIKSHKGGIGVQALSNEWKGAAYVQGIYGNIHISYFSDTFMIWTDYEDTPGFWSWLDSGFNEDFPLLFCEPNTTHYPRFYQKHMNYINFIEICMDFFCQSVMNGIPLRGCISTGLATLDTNRSIFVGSPIVEAARGETEQNSIGFAYGKSFNNHHPVWNRYHIPYMKHKKDPTKENSCLSPMMVDYPRYWREHYSDRDFIQLVRQMNPGGEFSKYYDNAIEFYKFSEKHENWLSAVDKNDINSILDFYGKSKEWLLSVD